MAKRKVVITGAAGRIGRVLREGLKESYDLRLLYNRTVLPAREDEEVFVADITDLEKMEQVVDGCDAVIHMAGNPEVSASFEDCHRQNSLGTWCVYEACVRRGCGRAVFASTNHVTGMYEKEGTPPVPTCRYAPTASTGRARPTARPWAGTTPTTTTSP